MRILIVNHRAFHSGGPETYMSNVSTGLKNRGHVLGLFSRGALATSRFAVDHYYDVSFPLDSNIFKNWKLPTVVQSLACLFFSFWSLFSFILALIRFRPDIVYLLNYYNRLSPSIVYGAYLLGIPIIARISDYHWTCPQQHHFLNGKTCYACFSSLTNGVKNRCVKQSYFASFFRVSSLFLHRYILSTHKRISMVLFTNEFARKVHIQSKCNFENVQVVHTPGNSLIEASVSLSPYVLKTRSGLQIIVDRNTVLYVGRFAPEKGLSFLIDNLKDEILTSKNLDLVFLGGEKEDFQRMHPQINISNDRTYFAGYMDEDVVRASMQACGAVVIPSAWIENLPNTFIEAAVQGVPVIVPDFGSFSEFQGRLHDIHYYLPNQNCSFMNALEDALYSSKDLSVRAETANHNRSIFSLDAHLEKLERIFIDFCSK